MIQLGNHGAWVENKKQSLTFHYRDVPEIDQPTYKERATSIIESHGYVANLAHAAVEAKPPVIWNKGSFIFQRLLFMVTYCKKKKLNVLSFA